ncbi:MAG: tRNA uridine-5-carboxymethylaminomethyl(34) synthesis GTPase MnmE, partial [Firmicutes bacterium]|nr:tRNA uridine-5-carboxymethylaminomethyl(34) synthesis GTPase MnmE [Bacillota bacterium]
VMLDSTAGIVEGDREIFRMVRDKKIIVLVNKIDLDRNCIQENELRQLAGGKPVLYISAEKGEGIAELEETIAAMVLGGDISATDEMLITNVRHKKALEKAMGRLKEAREAVSGNVPVDIVAIDIREAWEALGEITGKTLTEDVVERIFAEFCIGK